MDRIEILDAVEQLMVNMTVVEAFEAAEHAIFVASTKGDVFVVLAQLSQRILILERQATEAKAASIRFARY